MPVEVIIVALSFAALGTVGLFWPQRIYAEFGVELSTPDSRNEVRGVYGGMCVAFAGVLFLTPQLGAASAGVLIAMMAALGGMAGGRIFSLFIERTGKSPIIFLVLEALGAGLLYRVVDFTSLTSGT
ncbi:MAG: DUF4345 family protein [Kordiimonadaceae bacterium]|nr:DUF4345 family protein [Kordiimonadaceae bacterium]